MIMLGAKTWRNPKNTKTRCKNTHSAATTDVHYRKAAWPQQLSTAATNAQIARQKQHRTLQSDQQHCKNQQLPSRQNRWTSLPLQTIDRILALLLYFATLNCNNHKFLKFKSNTHVI